MRKVFDSQPAPVLQGRMAWYAVRAKTTHEKRVQGFLREQRIECLLPLYISRQRWSDRVKAVEKALFPGYVFASFDPWYGRMAVLSIQGVIGIVSMQGQPLAITEQDVFNLQHLRADALHPQPHPFMTKGQRVRIKTGAMEGVEGIISNDKRQSRLVVSISILQRSVSVEMDSALVERV